MAIYKVHVKTDGDKTIYTVNTTELISIARLANINKYKVYTDTQEMIVNTFEEADKTAREKITRFFAGLGIVPNFIIE